jgi:hypothetical protein
MALASIATAIAVGVGTNLITKKIVGDPDMPAQIGSGTSPSLTPGADININPIVGSEVQEFGDFKFEDLVSPEDGQKEMILAQLKEAGVDVADLDQYGIAGMAVGGYLNRANGGNLGLMALLKEQGLIPEDKPENLSGIADVDFSEIAEPKPEDLLEEQMMADINFEMPDVPMPENPLTNFQKLESFIDNQNPMVSEAIYGGLGSIGSALFGELFGLNDKKRKGSLVKTETLPGNSNRRRSQLDKISPIGGSSVTFANEGKVLQRPMFMPQGGPMRGPGGPKDDLIPVMASNGEYMLSKAVVDAAGGGSHAKGVAVLDKFNKMGNKRYGV